VYAALERDSVASSRRPSFSRSLARLDHARSREASVSRSRSKCSSSSWSRSVSETGTPASAIRCQRLRKSFTTPFPPTPAGCGTVGDTAVPQIAQSASSEKRYAPQWAQKGAPSSRLPAKPGSSASSLGAYWRPHIPHFVAPFPIAAPHVRQSRAGGPSSSKNSSSSSERSASADPANSTPQDGHAVAPVPTNEPHSGHRKSSSEALGGVVPCRTPSKASTSADPRTTRDASSSRVAASSRS